MRDALKREQEHFAEPPAMLSGEGPAEARRVLIPHSFVDPNERRNAEAFVKKQSLRVLKSMKEQVWKQRARIAKRLLKK